jgi:flavodoxin
MNACIVYFSRTGNTKKLAQALADATKAPIYDLSSVQNSTLEKCDLLILGTPVEGASPAKETQAFLTNLPQGNGKKVILFCTYKLFGNARTMKAMEKELSAKGYETILSVSKKGMKPDKVSDFSDLVTEVKGAIEKL